MSSRAIQRLRQGRGNEIPQVIPDDHEDDEDDDEDDEDDDDANVRGGKANAFAAMFGDDSDSESDSESNEDDEDEDEDKEDNKDNKDIKGDDGTNVTESKQSLDEAKATVEVDDTQKKKKKKKTGSLKNPEDYEENDGDENKKDAQEDDFDDILKEFQDNDDEFVEGGDDGANGNANLSSELITVGLDVRDLDIDYVMRTSLLGTSSNTANDDSSSARNRRGRQMNIFGPLPNGAPRPPHYVGGGIGMDPIEKNSNQEPESNTHLWPYYEYKNNDGGDNDNNNNNDDNDNHGDDSKTSDIIFSNYISSAQWLTYKWSENYQNDYTKFQRVKASGDPNGLALFIADHPYFTEALLQFSAVLYQTNRSQEGLTLLKRTSSVFECAALNSFLSFPRSDNEITRRPMFMDCDKKENYDFFLALFKLIRVAYVASLPRVCLAASKLLLSLDPLRDPMNVLLSIDHFTFLTMNEENMVWLIQLIESQKITINSFYEMTNKKYTSNDKHYHLLCMPNIAYSYALALYKSSKDRLDNEDDDDDDNNKEKVTNNDDGNNSNNKRTKADKAIQYAIKHFPIVLEQLLENGLIHSSTTFFMSKKSISELIQSFKETVISKTVQNIDNSIIRARTFQAYEFITKVYIHQLLNHNSSSSSSSSSSIWSDNNHNNDDNDIIRWLEKNLKELHDQMKKNDDKTIQGEVDGNNVTNDDDDDNDDDVALSPAIMRYSNGELSDYENKFQTMPAEADPLNPTLIQLATNIDTNRRRRHRQQQRMMHQQQLDEEELLLQMQFGQDHHGARGLAGLAAGGGGFAGPPTQRIDPDWPLVEIFWRSALPWAHVDGVVPPPRR